MRRVAVIPFGTGLGDSVKMRPILDAIVRARPEDRISVLCPAPYRCFLPHGVEALSSLAGVPLWRRPRRDSRAAFLLRGVSVRTATYMARGVAHARWSDTLSIAVSRLGFDEVINLLSVLGSIDLDRCWTPGPWSATDEHLTDALARYLLTHAIDLPPDQRRPRIPSSPGTPPDKMRIVLNPNAGSSLKEAPTRFWVSVAEGLAAAGHRPLLLQGQDGDRSADIHRASGATRLIAAPRTETLMRLLSSSDLVISPDTGVLHLAAALDVPYIGLFGSTNPAFLGPYGAEVKDILISATHRTDVCRGCWTGQLLPEAVCALNFSPGCLAELDPGEVLLLAAEKLRARGERAPGRQPA